MTDLAEGKKAPDFSLPTDRGTPFKLSAQKGKAVVVYFYPKDDTSGCTAQAKDFSCLADEFTAAGAVIVGISPDATTSKAKFRKKHELSVELAADEDKAVAQAWGVWVEKSMYGRKYMGVERTTFLVDPKGKLHRIWHKVKVPGHAEEVLEAVRALKA
ncbi:MAG: thioredoxin-dependent thiol peroxidase [Hyphomicrobiales bacterium]|nr:thioredoxin-dependent thiol peroxidase [Hyphomicrobiales bacterium]